MESVQVYLIFWLPDGYSFAPDVADGNALYMSLIERYFKDIGGSQMYNIVTQYYDYYSTNDFSVRGTRYYPNQLTLADSYVDTRAFPQSPLSSADIEGAVTNAIQENGWVAEENNWRVDEPDEPLHQLFFVYTPTGVQTCLAEYVEFCSGRDFAGYHYQLGEPQEQPRIIYSYIADLGPLPSMGPVFPNNQYADSAISTTAHELFESVTDPYLQGWDAPTGAYGRLEMADLCSPSRGSKLGPVDASSGANVTLNGNPYQVQFVYSNAAGGCTNSFDGQFINFDAPGNTTYGAAPFALSADATSLLPVTFTAEGACTVSNALVTVTGVGICTIAASQAGDKATGGFYDPATPVTRTFNVTAAVPAFTFDLTTMPPRTFGDAPFSVASYASKPADATGAITFATGSSSVGCTVTADGTVTIVGATGDAEQCVITASLAAGGNYTAAGPVSQSFTIATARSSVSVICPTPNPTYTGSAITGCTATESVQGQSLTVTYTGRNGTSYAASTTPPANAGDYTASASSAGDANHTGSSGNAEFSIDRAIPALTWNNPADITYGMALGGTQLNATASIPGTFTYTPPVGTILGAGRGQTLSVTFTPAETTNYLGAATSVQINVVKADQTITFGALSNRAFGSPQFTVMATGGPSGNPVTFTAGPASVCAASGTNGSSISLTGTGTCTVTASQAGNANYNAAPDVVRSFTVTAWTLVGFYQPVNMQGVVNTVKGGTTVPFKFEVFVGSTELTDTTMVTMSAKHITCASGAVTDDIEVVATGGNSLRYDTTIGQFIYNWQTPKQAGSCYAVTATTSDGSSVTAVFKLK